MSDTWFGSSTRVGEVAYSLNTYARSSHESFPHRAYRAVTPVVLRNEFDQQLALDRMNLPVPYLSLFGTPDHELWTERITLARREHEEMAVLDAGAGAPGEASGAVRLSAPRQDRSTGLLVRAFSTLLRTLQDED